MPGETTNVRSQNALVKGGVYDDLFSEGCRQIEGHGLNPINCSEQAESMACRAFLRRFRPFMFRDGVHRMKLGALNL